MGALLIAMAVAGPLRPQPSAAEPRLAEELAGKRTADVGPEITFSGYKALPDGRGILFVELTEPAPIEIERAGRVIEYRLVGARVPLRNNRNPLLLRDFNSSALSAVLVPDKKAVRLVVTLRASVSPTHKLQARGAGAVLEIELPAPNAR